MAALLPNVDPNGLLEFSVDFTDRSLNHMSTDFQAVMCDISKMLTAVITLILVQLCQVVELLLWSL